MVNGLFAAQKMQVTVDALILCETVKEYLHDVEQEKKKLKKKKDNEEVKIVVQVPSAVKQTDIPYLII